MQIQLLKHIEYLKEEAKRILNLEVETKKCKFIYFNNGSNIDHLDAQPPILTNNNEELSARVMLQRYGIPIYRDAAIVLGSAVGCDESKIHDILIEHIGDSHNQLFNLLQHPSLSVRNAMLLLRQCMIPKLNYLTRTVAPIVINSILQSFDSKVINTALHILDINKDLANDNSVRERVVNQLRACLRTGGFGLISSSSTSHAAYLSSLARCFYTDNQINATHPLFQSPSPKLLTNIQFSIDQLYISTQPHELASLIPPTAAEYIHKYSNNESIDHLQSTLVKAAHNNTYRALIKTLEDTNDEFNLARMKNITAISSSIWKVCTSNSNNGSFQRCSDIQYRINARLNLGLMPHRLLPNICGSCTKNIPINSSVQDAMHLLCCNHIKGTAITDRHNQVQQALEYYSSCCNFRVRRYLHNTNGSNTIFDTTLALGAETFNIDYVVSTSTAPSYVHQSATNDSLFIVKQHEHNKTQHHFPPTANNNVNISNGAIFYPFSVDIYGGLGQSARKVIETISLVADGHSCIYDRKELIYHLKSAIAMSIVRGNADCVLQCLQNATVPNARYKNTPRVKSIHHSLISHRFNHPRITHSSTPSITSALVIIIIAILVFVFILIIIITIVIL